MWLAPISSPEPSPATSCPLIWLAQMVRCWIEAMRVADDQIDVPSPLRQEELAVGVFDDPSLTGCERAYARNRRSNSRIGPMDGRADPPRRRACPAISSASRTTPTGPRSCRRAPAEQLDGVASRTSMVATQLDEPRPAASRFRSRSGRRPDHRRPRRPGSPPQTRPEAQYRSAEPSTPPSSAIARRRREPRRPSGGPAAEQPVELALVQAMPRILRSSWSVMSAYAGSAG